MTRPGHFQDLLNSAQLIHGSEVSPLCCAKVVMLGGEGHVVDGAQIVIARLHTQPGRRHVSRPMEPILPTQSWLIRR